MKTSPDMTISHEELRATTRRVHAAAEMHHRINGYTAPLLVAVANGGAETLILLPDGFPPQDFLDTIARQTRAAAFVVTAEAWVSIPGLSAETVAALPLEDLPLPVDDPNRLEAIITTAVGLGPEREPFTLMRASRIKRTTFGAVICEARDDFPGVHADHVVAQLAAALAQVPPAPYQKDHARTLMNTTPVHDPAEDSPSTQEEHAAERACPSCRASVGDLHTDQCDVAWCAAVGLQRYGRCDTAHGCRTDPRRDCRTTWGGLHPGFAECRELGWYAQLTPDGWVTCDPAAPGAIEDLNRLMTKGTWDQRSGRYTVPEDSETGAPEAGLPESGEKTGEGS